MQAERASWPRRRSVERYATPSLGSRAATIEGRQRMVPARHPPGDFARGGYSGGPQSRGTKVGKEVTLGNLVAWSIIAGL